MRLSVRTLYKMREAWTRTAVTDFLQPLRNQACWGGWQITLRSIDEWLT